MKNHPLRLMLPIERKPLLDVVLLGLLSAVCFILPFAVYVYRKASYDFPGYGFLTGRTIMNQTVQVPPTMIIALFFLPILVVLVTGLFFKYLSPRRGGALIISAGAIQLAFALVISTQYKSLLPGVKYVSTGFGLILMIVLGLILTIRGSHILYKHREISALDFFVLPGALYLLINNYIPMLGLFIAFKKIDYSVGIFASDWVGFDNFKYLFTTQDAWEITRNTVLYNLVFIIVGNLAGIIIGIAMANLLAKRLRKFYQTSILLPQLISYVIIGYVVFSFLSNESGYITQTILGGESGINFYAQKEYWPFLLVFINTWKSLGYSTIIYMSSIVSIDNSLYEAASIDGAGRFQKIFKITLPMIKPTIILLVMLQLGRMFYSDFGLFFQAPLNTGMLYEVTRTIDVYVYQMLMVSNQQGMASAASFYQSIVGLAIIVTVNFIVRKFSRENALF